MQNWQRYRNYRKNENDEGLTTYIITVDGVDVEVSEEIYKAYSQADRRERYSAERDTGRLLSLEKMQEDGFPIEIMTGEYEESPEETLLGEITLKMVSAAFEALEPVERDLIQALVIDRVAERDYAASIGLSQKGVNKRKRIILEKMKISVLKP